MKLGSLKEGGRDGTLVVVSRDLARAVRAIGIAPTLQRALEDWSNAAPRLAALSDALNDGSVVNANLGAGTLTTQGASATPTQALAFVRQ